MSIASAAGRPTRLRPVEARQPARATVTAAARRAMQAAAIPASLEAHRAAAAAALAPSQLLPEDRRPFVEALSRAALVAAAQRRRLVGRGKHGASGSTARISMRYHDLSYDAAHLTEAVLEEALDEPAAGRVVVATPARVRPRRSAKAARQSDV